jgi:capsular polysaccharide biosynthesis protein/Mrp family chromosome partitioning ATPase
VTLVEHQVLELRDVARMLWRHKLIVTAVLALSLAGSLALTLTTPKRYSASTRLLLLPAVPGSALRLTSGSSNAGPLGLDMDPTTQAQVIDSPLIAARVARSLGLSAGADQLAGVVAVRAGETQVLQIDATALDARLAAKLADSFAWQYVVYRRQLSASMLDALTYDTQSRTAQLQRAMQQAQQEIQVQQELAQSSTSGLQQSQERPRLGELITQRDNLADELTALRQRAADLKSSSRSVRSGSGQVIQRAVPPAAPFKPSTARNVAIGFLIGMVASMVSVFLIEYLDDRIRSRADVEACTGTPVLTVVPRLGLLRRARLRARSGGLLSRAERGQSALAFRRLRARLLANGMASHQATVMVASLDDGDEAAAIVARLAMAVARVDRRTLIISLDVRNHRTEDLLDVRRSTGLTDVLLDHQPLTTVAAATTVANLTVIPAGSGSVDDTDLFASTRLLHVLDEARQLADLVLVEVPRDIDGDLALLASHVDSSMVVARAGATRRGALRVAFDELGVAGTPVLGVVLADKVRPRRPGGPSVRAGGAHWTPGGHETRSSGPNGANSGGRE